MDQLPIECKFTVIACDIDALIEILEREGFIAQAMCVRQQFDEQIANP